MRPMAAPARGSAARANTACSTRGRGGGASPASAAAAAPAAVPYAPP